MEEQYFLDELLALRRDFNSDFAIPTQMSDLMIPTTFLPMESDFPFPMDQQNFSFEFQFHHDYPLGCGDFEVYNGEFPITNMEEEELGILEDEIHNLEVQVNCKLEPVQSPEMPVFNGGSGGYMEKKTGKKLQGQPSKNLMAERRRRKRLNERLAMLRSIVPKISKMDRTAILADAIDYVKELLEKIGHLQGEIEVGRPNELENMGIFRDSKPNEYLVRNSPKFDVERRINDTRIEICCSAKPGLLLSTVHTLEELGLDIQQCVISCFNDFAIQASCSEEMENRTAVSADDVKQALFENAGYGGRCL